MIDEAHSGGVLGHAGRGIGHHFPGVDPRDVDVWMGTLSKSFASCGGYIAGSKALVRYLKYSAGGFVYSAGITPPNAGSALKSLDHARATPRWWSSCAALPLLRWKARGQGHRPGRRHRRRGGAGDRGQLAGRAEAVGRLAKKRINVQPIVYPAVEDDAARLRFFISATHTEAQLAHTVDVLVEELAKVRAETLGEGAGARL
jgi:8-amino-7-oxononanoate synthase